MERSGVFRKPVDRDEGFESIPFIFLAGMGKTSEPATSHRFGAAAPADRRATPRTELRLLSSVPAGIALFSPNFADGGPIPRRYAGVGVGENISPAFRRSGVPPEAVELLLVLEDHWPRCRVRAPYSQS